MSRKKCVCVLAGAAVVVAAALFGILGCEQNATHEAGVKPAVGSHTEASPTPKTRDPAGPHTETPTPKRTPKAAGPHTEGPTQTPGSQ